MNHVPLRPISPIVISIGLAMLLGASAPALAKGGLPGFQVGERANLAGLPRVVQHLVAPPLMPQHDQIARGGTEDC